MIGGLAKQETYDKSGAIADFSQAITLEANQGDSNELTYSLENRAALYAKLGDYKRAAEDTNALIGLRLRNLSVFMNLEFFRKLYPEYGGVNDAVLKNKLHKMLLPNFSDETFENSISDPTKLNPTIGAGLQDDYLKRADLFLALTRFSDAKADYSRSQLFQNRSDSDRWRTSPALHGIAVDIQTLHTEVPLQVNVWVKPPEENGEFADLQPVRLDLDCQNRTVRMGEQGTASEPKPGSYSELLRDFFCSSR